MADSVPVIPVGAAFVVALRFRDALNAADLGEFLLALASDYRNFTKGRDLYLARVEQGSIFLHLVDTFNQIAPVAKEGLEAVKAANSVRDFVTKLRDVFGKEKETQSSRKGRRPVGTKSIQSMIKLAADSKSQIEIRYASTDGDSIDIKLTPQAAMSAQQQRLSDEALLRIEKSKERLLAPDQKALFETAAQLALAPDDEVESVLRLVVSSLLAAGLDESYLHSLADELESQGHYRVATSLRAKLSVKVGEQRLLRGP